MRGVTLQELDVQNAAAAEQHVKDMVDYDAKLTEAAAAWEAEKKKKKGKAKDEVAAHTSPCASLYHVPAANSGADNKVQC